ncbi:hypothetical protein P171DRAFT_523159 [Karstenula rhodostoma CBS 690.94]|uniref:F-box domain-containing protein n=1 Tax=Karstenula rhodostoma CBS 690.94 TaxID=1392251 RepID=A0A9P4PDX0_9PLEO|nr:hypothetical protein P171DRAFT_523159 [Karstenula rhodostoma CBS 690.94]
MADNEPEHSIENSDSNYDHDSEELDGMLDPTPRGEYVSLTERNRTESPLLRLPAELRTLIFRYAFTGLYIQTPKSRIFKPKNVAHPDLLRVSRVVYAECRFLPFTNARFIFATGLVEATVKGALLGSSIDYWGGRDHMNDFEILTRLQLSELRPRLAPIFNYSAQVNRIATMHTRVHNIHPILEDIKSLPGLKHIILRPCCNMHRSQEHIREEWLRWDQQKFTYIRGAVPSSIRVIFEAEDLLDYELEN